MKAALEKEGGQVKIIAPRSGFIKHDKGNALKVNKSLLTSSSILFDAIFLPDCKSNNILQADGDVIHFINETFRHCKAIAAEGSGADMIKASYVQSKIDGGESNASSKGVFIWGGKNSHAFF